MYDLLIVGGGLGYAGAVVAAKSGLRVALIHDDFATLGGTCLHHGCIPSKYLLSLAATELALKDEAFAWHKEPLRLERAQRKKRRRLAASAKAIERQCIEAGVELIEAKGRLVAPHRVEAAGEELEGRHVILATGSSPFIPEGIAYDAEAIITSDEALELEALPSSIAIYGAGAIGLEMASFFAALGCETTLYHRSDTLLPQAHPLIREAIHSWLERLGVELRLADPVVEAANHNGRARVVSERGIAEYEKLLVATGRRPNVDVVACGEVAVDRGIVTDERFATTLENHWAVGDCNARLMLAHAARAQVLWVVDAILGREREPLDLSAIPRFIHTLPLQFASVGRFGGTEAHFRLSHLALAHFGGAEDGVVALWGEDGVLAGAQILSPHAHELISVITPLLGRPVADLAHTTFPHPTYSEAIERAARILQRRLGG